MFDNFISKVKKAVNLDEDPYALFDEQCSSSGRYPAPGNVITASDLRRLIQEVSTGAHSPPRYDLHSVLDGTFAELAAAGTQLDSVLQLERGTASRAGGLKECAVLLNRGVDKEISAVDQLVKGALRCEIVVPESDQKKEGDEAAAAVVENADEKKPVAAQPPLRPKVAVYRKWAAGTIYGQGQNDAAIAAGMEKIASEKEEWDKIIKELEE